MKNDLSLKKKIVFNLSCFFQENESSAIIMPILSSILLGVTFTLRITGNHSLPNSICLVLIFSPTILLCLWTIIKTFMSSTEVGIVRVINHRTSILISGFILWIVSIIIMSYGNFDMGSNIVFALVSFTIAIIGPYLAEILWDSSGRNFSFS